METDATEPLVQQFCTLPIYFNFVKLQIYFKSCWLSFYGNIFFPLNNVKVEIIKLISVFVFLNYFVTERIVYNRLADWWEEVRSHTSPFGCARLSIYFMLLIKFTVSLLILVRFLWFFFLDTLITFHIILHIIYHKLHIS